MGITVLTYNSRGTGSSTGKASWTGEAERRDFGNVVEWLLEQELEEKGIGAGSTTMLCCVSHKEAQYNCRCRGLILGL